MTRRSCPPQPPEGDRGRRRKVVVGLVNNMSDGALRATETQFCGLIQDAAAPDLDIAFRYFSLDEIPRGDDARAHMRGRYEPIRRLDQGGLDALVVTGAEPRAPTFEEEAYWPSLARVIDWADGEQIPTVWSCLAAHASVWRLHGVRRRLQPTKHSGVFALRPVAHPLLAGAPAEAFAPHSRWNDLDAGDLEAAGYEILARSPEVGVDTFVKAGGASSIFFQGHPEYDAGALGREFLRDVSRFQRGQQTFHPPPPTGYFGRPTLDVLTGLAERMERTRDPGLLGDYAGAVEASTPAATWRPWALFAYRLWLRSFSVTVDAGRKRPARVVG